MELEVESIWSGLPLEVLERVLSFVPALSLCRFRTVCRKWRELLCKTSFHELCDRNGKEEKYLFVSRYLSSECSEWCLIDPDFKQTICFLDLDAGRWYSIRNGLSPDEAEDEGDTRVLAMDDGLVCELNCTYDTLSCTGLVISNPVTKTRRALLAPPIYWGTVYNPPVIVPVANKIARSFVVFLMHNFYKGFGMLLFDSATNEWRDLKSPAEEFGVEIVLSAVFFRGALYAVFEKTCRQFGNLRLLRYTPEENLWGEVSAPLTPPGNLSTSPKLLVVGDRLIMMLWMADPSSLNRGSMYDASFQVLEILVPENTSRRLFRMSIVGLQDHFAEDAASVQYGIPTIDSNGHCTSVTLMSTSSGKLVTYDLRRRVASGFPPHPLGQGPLEGILDPTGFSVYARYVCRYMSLSLRDV